MTLQQLKYVVAIADKGSINEAAKYLFISQPSLSNAIKDLEKEIKITIFTRTNRGIQISSEGAEFLGYARQVLQQSELLEQKYLSGMPAKQRFSVSTHHYLFAANAFVDLIKEFGGEEYEFTFRETKTYEVIDDVKNLRSEIGLIYLSDFNAPVIGKLLKESNLVFTELFTARPHVFLYKHHPLAQNKTITLEELEDYPCVSFEQGDQNSFYFSEEVLSTRSVKKSIKVSDRAAVVNMMIGVNAYTFSTGVFPEYLHGEDIVSIPLEADEKICVGTIIHKDTTLTHLGEIYLEALKRIAENLKNKVG
ncbi:LysR family transcriptional regulator [Cellulosilyticum lentocellum]|uniref:Transcriptional regulator, LysR family n=1 Tax=Cellulosilyticum lentocellum (strain ATCC 49066 / DSM 5427 / NCIMB 11756 / RHM5) TaxID=642492 RepID=F2JHW7_CELLD|nr:LysR family transcriptional regulator [Cellulosilyticum lentocellum]ADZ81911.1 transcriptional regulator, LysR family [Cellulosilyticum lentocellum DSM 5427]